MKIRRKNSITGRDKVGSAPARRRLRRKALPKPPKAFWGGLLRSFPFRENSARRAGALPTLSRPVIWLVRLTVWISSSFLKNFFAERPQGLILIIYKQCGPLLDSVSKNWYDLVYRRTIKIKNQPKMVYFRRIFTCRLYKAESLIASSA